MPKSKKKLVRNNSTKEKKPMRESQSKENKSVSHNSIKEKQKCKGCHKAFLNLKQHVTKSFTCQNAYMITELLNDCMTPTEDDRENRLIGSSSSKEKKSCLGCSKKVLNMVLHVKRSGECQAFYDLDAMEKEKRKDKKVRNTECKRRERETKRTENEELFKGNLRSRQNEYNAKKKAEDEEQFRENLRSGQNRFRAKKKAEDEEQFRKKLRFEQNKLRAKKRAEDDVQFKEKIKIQVKEHREKRIDNWGRLERLIAFKNEVKFGAIFVCICCQQRLFEKGVKPVTEKFKTNIESKKFGLYNQCVIEEKQEINGKKESYICHTCQNTMKSGKMPAMSIRNGLQLTKLDDTDLKLSEIENNLIAQNIVFQKIFLLPKSRMSAVKDRLVNVPIGPTDIANTIKSIPRTPKEAGLIQVKLKRKLEYKNVHKHEYIDPQKIFKALELLKKKGHPYYKFYDDYNTFKCRWAKEGL